MFQLNRSSLNLIAAVLGIIATGIPMILFNVWLQKQGDQEVTFTAAWALESSEAALGRAAAALSELTERDVVSCEATHIDAMRQAVLATGPVKQIVLVAADGRILCTDTGGSSRALRVLSSTATALAGIVLDVVRTPERGDRFVRVRRLDPADRPGLAALVPASLLLPQRGRFAGQVRIAMADGTIVGETEADGATEPHFVSRMRSQRYGFTVTVSAARGGVIANYDDLRRIGMVASGAIAIVILFFALIYSRRRSDNSVAEVAKAILKDEFVPFYQPVVDIQTGRLLGAEVLARRRRPDGHFIEPIAFVPLMESSGLVLELTRTLMRRACEDLGKVLGRRGEMTIAFNVDPRHFDDALILNDVGTIFDGSPIKLSQVVLELTERQQVKNLASTRRTIAALQGLGCKVAIDDVGTGHSGLSYLLKLGVDIIKIDRIFVEDISTDSPSRAIIETLIDLAKNMRMEIVAEGVESFDQVTYLRERGITAAQGYAFAPPLSASSFIRLVEAMDPAIDAPARPRALTARVAGL